MGHYTGTVEEGGIVRAVTLPLFCSGLFFRVPHDMDNAMWLNVIYTKLNSRQLSWPAITLLYALFSVGSCREASEFRALVGTI